MKKKIVYIYGGLFVLIVIALIFSVYFNNSDSKLSKVGAGKISSKSQMPGDEIHSNINPTAPKPNKGNVSKNIIHEMDMLKKQIEKNPSDTVSINKYAELLFASHKQTEAIEYYKKILNIDKKRKDVYLNLVFAFYNLRDMNNAEKYTKELIKYFPDDLQGKYNLGAINASQGKNEAALNIWTKLIAKYPDSEEAKLAKSSIKRLKN